MAIPNPPTGQVLPAGPVGPVVPVGLVGLVGLAVPVLLVGLTGVVVAGLMGLVELAGPVLPVGLAAPADRHPLIFPFSHINRAQTTRVPAEAAKNSNIAAETIERPGRNGIIF